MRILILDPFHGAAGDMVTGALLGCGADKKAVVRAMKAVVAAPAISQVDRAGIRAVYVKTQATPAHRTYDDVLERIRDAEKSVPEEALDRARRVFSRIHAAEERVHGEHVHFHEVGADDAIADVIGACTALESLHADAVFVLPVALGQGTGKGSHGIFPVPAPATAAILAASSLTAVSGGGDGELCTPTGAALLAEFATPGTATLPPYRILGIGYGAGTRNPHDGPNVLRAMLAETATEAGLDNDTVDVLETNVDDVSGEEIAHTLARLMDGGARDASAVPVIMKKGRPGFLIRVICPCDASARMAEQMARELGTLGIRCTPSVHRFIAEREILPVRVRIGSAEREMPVKAGLMHGKVYTLKAEFDPARDWAQELDLPVRDVVRAIETAGWEQVGKHAARRRSTR